MQASAGRLKLLVLRCEDDNASKQAALNQFLGRTDLKLGLVNVTADKPAGELYARVKEQLKLPPHLCQLYYRSRLVRHFYTEDEVAAFRRRWGCDDG